MAQLEERITTTGGAPGAREVDARPLSAPRGWRKNYGARSQGAASGWNPQLIPSVLALATAALFALTAPLSAEPSETASADGKDRYIIVLAPGNGQKPDVPAAGGTSSTPNG